MPAILPQAEKARLRRMVEAHPDLSHKKLADLLGVDEKTIRNARAAQRDVTPEPSYAAIPEEDLPAEEIIDILARRQKLMRESVKARQWRAIHLDQKKPFGIVWFMDVHLGDPGTDYEALRQDLAIAAETPHLYSAFVGDASNSWPMGGKLVKKWADQETSLKTERRLVEWFLRESRQRWLFWVLGNHDAWNDGSTILRQMNIDLIPMEDWRAKFRLVMASGREVRIDAAHDFKGSSIWNSLHALIKEAKLGEEAHLYIAGHRHTSAVHTEEIAERGAHHKPWLVRCRGYKFLDEYAHRHQFAEQSAGRSVLTIVDPSADGPNAITQVFEDLKQGAEFLTYLRQTRR